MFEVQSWILGASSLLDRQAPSLVTLMHFSLTILWASFHTKTHVPIIFDWLPDSLSHL